MVHAETWGSSCGSMQPGHRYRWIRHEWATHPDPRHPGEPFFRCTLTYRPFAYQIVSLEVHAFDVSRAQAEGLVDELVVPYLRRDLAFIARGLALWGHREKNRYQTPEVEMEGRWDASYPHDFSLRVSVPYHY